MTTPVQAQDLLSHDAFADAFIREFSKQAPNIKVRKVGALHLEVEKSGEPSFTAVLDNAYCQYRASPEALPDVLATYVATHLERPSTDIDSIDTAKIVPVIKGVNFVRDDMHASLSLAYESYNAELVILFAEATDLRTRYISEEALTKLGFPPADRLARAIKNLRALLPEGQFLGGDGTYRISAGNCYEASILLFDEFWQSEPLPVKGEVVVAIPTGSVLVVTGSQDASGLELMRGVVSDVMNIGASTITDRLFVYRDGRFVPFGS